MKKLYIFPFIVLLVASDMVMVSCSNGQKRKTNQDSLEQEAAAVGKVSKDILTAELKQEVKNLMTDLSNHSLQEQISSIHKNILITSTSTQFMLPISKVNEVNTIVQKARIFGIYLTDTSVLLELNKPIINHKKVMAKLAVDLDIPFNFNEDNKEISFLKELFDTLIENDRFDVLMEIIGGTCVEQAMVYAAPGTMINDNLAIEELGKDMKERLAMILKITKELAAYYSHLQLMTQTLESLQELVNPISRARKSRAQIGAMRGRLLK